MIFVLQCNRRTIPEADAHFQEIQVILVLIDDVPRGVPLLRLIQVVTGMLSYHSLRHYLHFSQVLPLSM